MFARAVHVRGSAADIERGVAAYREQVLPYLREVTGFRGFALLLDREGGRALALTLWESEQALRGYESTGERFRSLLAETWATPVTGLDTYEVALLELAGASG